MGFIAWTWGSRALEQQGNLINWFFKSTIATIYSHTNEVQTKRCSREVVWFTEYSKWWSLSKMSREDIFGKDRGLCPGSGTWACSPLLPARPRLPGSLHQVPSLSSTTTPRTLHIWAPVAGPQKRGSYFTCCCTGSGRKSADEGKVLGARCWHHAVFP